MLCAPRVFFSSSIKPRNSASTINKLVNIVIVDPKAVEEGLPSPFPSAALSVRGFKAIGSRTKVAVEESVPVSLTDDE
jgi:hypothetical protein